MLKKACAIGALVITTASGALLTSLPATAAAPAWGHGGWGWHRSSVAGFTRSSNFNANENALFNRIRLRIRNRNNNVAVNNQRQQERQRQRQFQTNFDFF